MAPFSATTGFSIDFDFRFCPAPETERLPLDRAEAEGDPSPARAASGFASGGAGAFSTASPAGGLSSARINAWPAAAGETRASSLGGTEPAGLGPMVSVTLLKVPLMSGFISRPARFSIPPASLPILSLPTPSLLSGLPIVFRALTVRMADRVTFPAWAVIVAVPTEFPSTLKVPLVLPPGTVTVAGGAATPGLLLRKLTTNPLDGAGPVRLNVAVADASTKMTEGLRFNAPVKSGRGITSR